MSSNPTQIINLQSIQAILNLPTSDDARVQTFFHDSLEEILASQHRLERAWQTLILRQPPAESVVAAEITGDALPPTPTERAPDLTAALTTLERTVHKLTGVACYGHVPQLHQQCQTLGFLLRDHLSTNMTLSTAAWNTLRGHYYTLLDTLSNLAFSVNPPEQLQDFLADWDTRYQQRVEKLPLFQPAMTQQWSEQQKQQFVRLFYHARGHFYKFLWLLGNEAPNQADKAVILANIQEEFGEAGLSHEKLYEVFAQVLGVEVNEEFLYDFSHVPYLKAYNLTHLTWLDTQDWQGKSAAFSAYERLDNIDYHHLENLVRSFGVTGRGLAFFKVHNKADHFDRTVAMLENIWANDRQQVNRAFAFIGRHQLNMWTWLSTTLSEMA